MPLACLSGFINFFCCVFWKVPTTQTQGEGGMSMEDCRDEDGAEHPSGSFKNGLFLKVVCLTVLAGSNSMGALRRVWMMISGWQNSRMGKSDVPTPREV